MNISSIVEMLKVDPTLADDVPAFLARMNAQDVPTSTTVTTTVKVVEGWTSQAEKYYGGLATEADVQQAIAKLAAEPVQLALLAELEAKVAATTAAILSGEVTDSTQLDSKLTTLDSKLTTTVPVLEEM